MRVLVVTNDLPPRIGGIQYYVDQLCRGLVEAGDEVTVYGSTHDGADDWDRTAPYAVVRATARTLLPTPTVLRHAQRLIEHTRAEVVIFGATFPLALLGPRLAARTGVPYVGFTHGLEVSTARLPGGPRLLRTIGARAAAITYVSHWCRDILEPAFGSEPLHAMLPPAVDPAVFNPGVDGSKVRAGLGIGDEPVVVCVSRMVERKGQDQLIRSLPELRRRVDGARLLIVGGGPHESELRALAGSVGVSEWVTIVGEVSDRDLPAHFAAGDVFAMPCRERRGGREVEAFGIVFIQAQAIGRPVVAGGIGGVPDALAAGRTGVLVDGEDLGAVTDAVASLLGDPERATVMGAAGSRFVRDGFTWDRRTADLRELLKSAISRSGGSASRRAGR